MLKKNIKKHIMIMLGGLTLASTGLSLANNLTDGANCPTVHKGVIQDNSKVYDENDGWTWNLDLVSPDSPIVPILTTPVTWTHPSDFKTGTHQVPGKKITTQLACLDTSNGSFVQITVPGKWKADEKIQGTTASFSRVPTN